MIFASNLWETERDLTEALLQYAQNGGILYVGGVGDQAFIEKITGGKILKMSDYSTCYFAPKKQYESLFSDFTESHPLHMNGSVPLIELDGSANILATLTFPYTKPTESCFASIHSDPPGIKTAYPAVLERAYGKGKIIYSADPIENEEYIIYQRINTTSKQYYS